MEPSDASGSAPPAPKDLIAKATKQLSIFAFARPFSKDEIEVKDQRERATFLADRETAAAAGAAEAKRRAEEPKRKQGRPRKLVPEFQVHGPPAPDAT